MRSLQPGHRLQLDVKFLERIPGTRKRLHQFTAIDDSHPHPGSQNLHDACNQSLPAIRFVDEVIRRLPFRILVVQTDNGAEFQSRLPLAPRVARYPPRLYQAQDAALLERQGGTVSPDRRPGVLPAPRPGRHHRRHSPVQREAAGVGGLLQLPPPAWGPGRPNPMRTAPPAKTARLSPKS